MKPQKKQVFYGTLSLGGPKKADPVWKVVCRPQVAIVLKNVFPRAIKNVAGQIHLHHTEEVCRNLEWFMLRYPLEISPADLKVLSGASILHQETLLRLEEMIGPDYKPREFSLALPPRGYQKLAADLFLARKSLLLADDVGLGKTATAICALSDPLALPAVVVTLAGTMPQQWEDEFTKFLPSAFVHVVKKKTPYKLPERDGRGPDVLVINYHKLSGWSELLGKMVKGVVFDEVQELRHDKSDKYMAARHVAGAATYKLGLSATPIYNYGDEMYNVLSVLRPGVLGTFEEFSREWCTDSRVRDPKGFGGYLREQFLMLRRTRTEVGRELPPLTKIIQTVDTDKAPLEEVKGAAAELAQIILSGDALGRGDAMRASGELDWKLRHATGVAKAPHVADFVRLLVENGESVVVYAWHRGVYEILLDRLADYKPALFTGQESATAKLESRRRFMEGETPVLLISLRAGAGVDGFQKCCRTVVFAELDWSSGVHDQCVGRVARDGQVDPVTVYFLVSEEGSDPVVSETLGIKRMQLEGIRDPNQAVIEELQATQDRSRSLAAYYLEKIGMSGLVKRLESEQAEKAEKVGT